MPPHSPATVLRRLGAAAAAIVSLAILLTVVYLPLPAPAAILTVLLGLATLAAWRIDVALVVLACTVPIARVGGQAWLPGAAWPEMLALAVIAGWLGRRAASPRHEWDRLSAPLAVAAAIVICSLAVVVTLGQWRQTGALITRHWLQRYGEGYFLMESSGDAVDTAMRLLEMLVLFRAAASVAALSPSWIRNLAAAMTAGAAAAAAVNLWALWTAAGSDFFRAFLTARVNVHYADPNAAGSYFVMMLAVAIGLVLPPKGGSYTDVNRNALVASGFSRTDPARVLFSLAAGLIAMGLWISGSRTAIMAGLLAMLVPLAARAGARRSAWLRPRLLVIAALLVAAAVSTAYLLPHRGTQRSANDALQVRWELSKSSVRMLATAPLFGVGVGNYFNLSGQFASKELLALFPPAARENAHNYYLQLLAELGIAGFVAFGWIAWVSGRRLAALLRDREDGGLRWGSVIAIVAFALTCAGGHPVLIDDPAFTFALLAGAAVGWSPATTRADGVVSRRWPFGLDTRRAAIVAIVGLLVTVPFRWYSTRAAMDLSDVAFGLTGWYTGRDGVAYRLAGSTSLIYVPAAYRAITIPLRATHPHEELHLVIRVDGSAVEEMRIRADGWQVIRVALPPQRGAARFRRLDLEVTTRAQTPRVLFIGRIAPT